MKVKQKVCARITISLATDQDREIIFQLRHQVYARELGQHQENSTERLTDSLDSDNVYLVASLGNKIVGFISITPPTSPTYSIDKYLQREQLPFPFDDKLYEIRLLTVAREYRGRPIAALLMYSAFRWVEAHGGTRIMAIGRHEILDLYMKAGLQTVGLSVQSGRVNYEVLQTSVSELREHFGRLRKIFDKIESEINWQLNFSFQKPAACFHGGAFFKQIGERFDSLEKREQIINADVLDAWFPPSPRVTAALNEHLDWLLRTSPPTGCEGLIHTIEERRGVGPESVLPGAGSSDLIFLALRHWLNRGSRVLILDPTYGEYAHVLEQIIGCQVERLTLSAKHDYTVDLARLATRLRGNYDLVVLVNPNSPTGRHLDRTALEAILSAAPSKTKFWIDETYIEYAGENQSLEKFAAQSENVVICKSMSKVYALSGARAAYLCAPPHLLEELRAITPPWAVSLLGQLAAVRALEDPDYYAARYAETHWLRKTLQSELCGLGWAVVPGIANFLLCHLPLHQPDAATVVRQCRAEKLFLRDASVMGSQLGDRALRIAVKDQETNSRMLKILGSALQKPH